MARYSSRPGELGEQLVHAFRILGDLWIEFGIRAFQIGVGHNSRPAMTWSGNVNGIQIMGPDQPVHMDVDEVESGRGSEMPQQPGFYMFQLQRLAQQRIVVQIDLPD